MIGRKQKIFLERNSKTKDAVGSWVETWSTIKQFKGYFTKMRDTSGETIRYDKETNINQYKIIANYFTDILTEDRIRINSRLFDIKGINNVDMNNINTEIIVEERD
ncbi:MAG: head-tail adaptor protein [Candidatus Cloacimonetes bacterium]|nr:head-tail adaptor protein [Candidatus Cloacimonadota bacterium]